MQDKKQLTAFLGIALLAFFLGVFAGFFARDRFSGGETSPAAPVSPTSSLGERGEEPSSKVVKHVTKSASGEVVKVADDELQISEGGDTLGILVAFDAKVTRITIPKSAALPENASSMVPRREEIKLSGIKVGDKVEALLQSQPDGSFEATEVTVFVE